MTVMLSWWTQDVFTYYFDRELMQIYQWLQVISKLPSL